MEAQTCPLLAAGCRACRGPGQNAPNMNTRAKYPRARAPRSSSLRTRTSTIPRAGLNSEYAEWRCVFKVVSNFWTVQGPVRKYRDVAMEINTRHKPISPLVCATKAAGTRVHSVVVDSVVLRTHSGFAARYARHGDRSADRVRLFAPIQLTRRRRTYDNSLAPDSGTAPSIRVLATHPALSGERRVPPWKCVGCAKKVETLVVNTGQTWRAAQALHGLS